MEIIDEIGDSKKNAKKQDAYEKLTKMINLV
jgi:hypothetical protein